MGVEGRYETLASLSNKLRISAFEREQKLAIVWFAYLDCLFFIFVVHIVCRYCSKLLVVGGIVFEIVFGLLCRIHKSLFAGDPFDSSLVVLGGALVGQPPSRS